MRARWWWWWFSVFAVILRVHIPHPSARGYPLSGVGRGARAGYAAFIFEGFPIFLQIANFPLGFSSKLNGVG